MEVISNPSGNGSNGVIGMLLQLLLKIDEESVASSHYITRASPKSIMSQLYFGVNKGSLILAMRLEWGKCLNQIWLDTQ
jgi:hypothetical protein